MSSWTPTAELLRVIRRLVDTILQETKKPIQNAPVFKVRWGIVVSVDAPTPGTLLWPSMTVRIGGSIINNVSGIRYASNYFPYAGDKVLCLSWGRDCYALSALAGDVHGGPDSKTFVIMGTVDLSSTTPVPPFPYPVPGSAVLESVVIQLLSGTCTLDIQQNGTTLDGMGSLGITTSQQTFTPTNHIDVENLDLLGPDITAIDGAAGLTVCFIFEVSS